MEETVEIEVVGARYMVIIGARPEERERLQPVELSLRLALDPGVSLSTDSLCDTVSYSALLKAAAAVLQEGKFHLLEAAAHAIATELLSHAAVHAATVRVAKIRPPVEADLQSVAAIVNMARA